MCITMEADRREVGRSMRCDWGSVVMHSTELDACIRTTGGLIELDAAWWAISRYLWGAPDDERNGVAAALRIVERQIAQVEQRVSNPLFALRSVATTGA